MNQTKAAADMVIFGGGIAGLWVLNRLRQLGFSAILFEPVALGGGQTNKAQGIIHGGMKYALQGVFTSEANAMAAMPERWKACLKGKGDIDLSSVPVLSKKQYLWSQGKLTAKLTGFLAGVSLASKVKSLKKNQYPTVFQHPEFKGQVFALDELVVDVPALVRELVKANQDAIFQIEPLSGAGLHLDEQDKLLSVTVCMAGKSIEVSAQQFIFTAGVGNEVVLNQLRHQDMAMQRRPLHMVLVKLPFDYPLYAHCLGLGARPRITITTHYLQDGSAVWYLGGLLAEEGVNRDSDAQVKAAQQELASLFPWLDFSAVQFATFTIDRAEPRHERGLKPETAHLEVVQNMMIAWPTKLALAPQLAQEVVSQIEAAKRVPQLFDVQALRAWPMPPLARPIWESAFCKKEA